MPPSIPDSLDFLLSNLRSIISYFLLALMYDMFGGSLTLNQDKVKWREAGSRHDHIWHARQLTLYQDQGYCNEKQDRDTTTYRYYLYNLIRTCRDDDVVLSEGNRKPVDENPMGTCALVHKDRTVTQRRLQARKKSSLWPQKQHLNAFFRNKRLFRLVLVIASLRAYLEHLFPP